MQLPNALIINFYYGINSLDPLFNLEEKLRTIIEDKKLGHYDGHAVNMDDTDGILFMYGDNPEEIYEAIKPILVQTHFIKGAVINIEVGIAGQRQSASFIHKDITNNPTYTSPLKNPSSPNHPDE